MLTENPISKGITVKHPLRLLATVCGAVVLASTAAPAAASQTFTGTLERFAHGFLEVRSFDDCKMHQMDLPIDASDAFVKNVVAQAARRHNVQVVTRYDKDGIEEVVDVRSSSRSGDADKSCVTDLGPQQHVDGVITRLGFGNNGAGLDLRIASGHTISFSWVYAYGAPNLNDNLHMKCDEFRTQCTVKGRVRVTYRTRVSGDGAELVPISVDRL